MEIESWSDVEEEMVTRKYLTAILRKQENYYYYCIMKNTVILWYMVAARLVLSHTEFEKLLIPKSFVEIIDNTFSCFNIESFQVYGVLRIAIQLPQIPYTILC